MNECQGEKEVYEMVRSRKSPRRQILEVVGPVEVEPCFDEDGKTEAVELVLF